MSKISKFTGNQKLAILEELEKEGLISKISTKYDISPETISVYGNLKMQ